MSPRPYRALPPSFYKTGLEKLDLFGVSSSSIPASTDIDIRRCWVNVQLVRQLVNQVEEDLRLVLEGNSIPSIPDDNATSPEIDLQG